MINELTETLDTYGLFIQESNMLAHRFDTPDAAEVNAYRVLMAAPSLNMAGLTHLATAISPGALPIPELTPHLMQLLREVNLGVAALEGDLKNIMVRDRESVRAQQRAWLAYTLHRALHELQPYRGGEDVAPAGVNGIIGRAAWLWVMGGIQGPFLTTWYQQSLRFGGTAQIEKEG